MAHRNRNSCHHFSSFHLFGKAPQSSVLWKRISWKKNRNKPAGTASYKLRYFFFWRWEGIYRSGASLFVWLRRIRWTSLFQYINRTSTDLGKKRLAHWLNNHLESKEEIEKRQEGVKELTSEFEMRQHFRILGLLYKGNLQMKKR